MGMLSSPLFSPSIDDLSSRLQQLDLKTTSNKKSNIMSGNILKRRSVNAITSVLNLHSFGLLNVNEIVKQARVHTFVIRIVVELVCYSILHETRWKLIM